MSKRKNCKGCYHHTRSPICNICQFDLSPYLITIKGERIICPCSICLVKIMCSGTWCGQLSDYIDSYIREGQLIAEREREKREREKRVSKLMRRYLFNG